jgi:hypothetical protein
MKMTKDEALKLALEALIEVTGWQWAGPMRVMDEVEDAITAIKQALEQPEPEPVALSDEWTPCIKLPIVVHVRKQWDGENHVSTREGITPIRHDDLIMRGVAGEEYPIGRELFERTYTFNTSPPKREPLTSKQVVQAFLEMPMPQRYSDTFMEGVRFAEAAHGIGEKK